MKKVLMIFLFVFLFACQDQIVELDIPNHTPLLVVNGFLDTDTIISLHVSNSIGAFENEEIHSISDANVLLYENNILLGSMQSTYVNDVVVSGSSGNFGGEWSLPGTTPIHYYTFPINPEPAVTYSIDVSYPNYESVFSQTTIPYQIDTLGMSVTDNSNESDVYSSKLDFSFLDKVNENNYYKIRLFLRTDGDWWNNESGLMDYQLTMFSNDPSFSQGIPWDGYSFSGEAVLFSDDLFNGMEKEISLDFEYKIEGIDSGDSIFLELTSFSEEAYHYFNSMETNRGSFSGPFGTEPSPIFSNIENGIGIFASGSSVVFQVLP